MGEQKTGTKAGLPNTNGRWFRHGLVNGFPICMGYFAVSFALGIAAKNVHMDALQSFFMSLGMVASAGEFAAITLIGAVAGALEMIFTTLIVNLRYFLMSCSLTQKLDPKLPFYHRFLVAYCMTDEIFGLSVSVPGFLNPFYTYGLMVISVSGWLLGTVLGVLVGNIIPVVVSNALGVAIYGMFLAIIIPPGKKDRFILKLVVLSMVASGLFALLPVLKTISSGFKIIILTVVIAGIAAAVRPIHEDEENKEEELSRGGEEALRGSSIEEQVLAVEREFEEEQANRKADVKANASENPDGRDAS